MKKAGPVLVINEFYLDIGKIIRLSTIDETQDYNFGNLPKKLVSFP